MTTTRIGLRQRLGPAREFLRGHQSLSITFGMAIAAVVLPLIVLIPPFNGFGTQKDFVGGFADAGVFVLLAIGLNVVVAWPGCSISGTQRSSQSAPTRWPTERPAIRGWIHPSGS